MIFKIVRCFVHILALFMTSAALAVGILFMFLHFAGIKYYVIVSGSMEPAIMTGSVVFVNTKEVDEVTAGDVAAYEASEGVIVVHRCISVDEDGYRFRGDANDTSDFELVQKDQLVGRCRFTVPRAGYALGYLKTGSFGFPVQIFYLAGMLILVNVLDAHLTKLADQDEEDPDDAGDMKYEEERG